MTDTRSEFSANLTLVDDTPSWAKPSRCKRPPYVMDGARRRTVDSFEDGWRDVEAGDDTPLDPRIAFPSPPTEPAAGFWHRLLVLICGH